MLEPALDTVYQLIELPADVAFKFVLPAVHMPIPEAGVTDVGAAGNDAKTSNA
jgi:hypothetical protein